MVVNLYSVQIGSATLFSLYVVVKYLGPEWINWLLGWYFSLAGVASVWKVLDLSQLKNSSHALAVINLYCTNDRRGGKMEIIQAHKSRAQMEGKL